MTRTKASNLPFLLLFSFFLLGLSNTASAGASDLLSSLTSQLGVTEEQAMGGAGAIFDYAKDNLSAEDFAKIASGIPGMDGLLSAAPAGGSGSMLGQAGSMLGGSAGSMGGLASLAGAFESLGLSADTVSQFLPLVYDFVGESSGSDALGLLKGLF